ncbi:unnamed protein product [Clavelina lepadiformis]|uniref:Ribose-phosphate pyrophosphokinase 4 n=1 Tax=Clavelina lepadiformis TaxID=159417 RepID=A0ABP0FL18_CLALP
MASSSSMDDVILFCHSSTYQLGEQVADIARNRPSGKKIDFRKDVQWKKFPDGYPNLFIQNIEDCVGKNVVFLGSFHSPEVVFEQISLLYVLPRSSIRSLTFILPYFPTGTMERVDTEGQVATAYTMARMLSAIPLSAMGPAKIVIYDIHALQERFFFGDNTLPHLSSAIPYFVKEIEKLVLEGEPISIAFPDDGAHKRFQKYFTNFPIVRCIKRRNGSLREVSIVDGSPQERHVIVVDDLIMTGGTMRKCIETLSANGAAKVSAYVTHPVFPQDSWKKFTHNGCLENLVKLDTFWITDSIPHANEISNHQPFKLLSLAWSVHDVLQNIVQH